MSGSLFSEAWHRVAQSRAKLKSEVEIQRHTFLGTTWYIFRDPLTNQYTRLSPPAYYFACRLRLDRTVKSVWCECLDLYPDQAPSQVEVIYLLAQLTRQNLLSSDLPPDVTQTFSRLKKTQTQEWQGRLLNFLYLRLPLVDPNLFFQAALPFIRPFLSPLGFLLWVATLLCAVVIGVEHATDLWDRSNGFFAPSNILLLYLAGVVTKCWHEFGHGILCHHFGGRVHTLGVMLLLLTPVPYVDVSSSWSFARRKRIWVAAGGMVFEFLLAAFALLLWVHTKPGPFNALVYNIFVLSSIVTLFFNINPLLRFDGYYIFSDFIQIPNLYQRSVLQLKYLLEKHLFLARKSLSPAQGKAEGHVLWIYGLAGGAYRLILLWSIFFTLAGAFLGLGLIIALFILVIWVVLPVGKFIYYLAYDPLLQSQRGRAIGIVSGAVASVAIVLLFIPVPHHFWANGMVEVEDARQVYTETSGSLDEVITPPGKFVQAQSILLTLRDPLCDFRIKDAQASLNEAENELEGNRDAPKVLIQAARLKLQAAWDRLAQERTKHQELTVRAPVDGVWVAPDLSQKRGSWLPHGSILGEIIPHRRFRFHAIVPQSQAANLFAGPLEAWIRLPGESQIPIRAESIRIIPAQNDKLPSAALGWHGGGDIETDDSDTSGLKAKRPFYEVFAELDSKTPATLLQRRRGVTRFSTRWEPLFTQIYRFVLQTFQQRVEGLASS